MDVILEKLKRLTNKEVRYVLLSTDRTQTIKTYKNLYLIVGWAKLNGYNIVNLKEFLESEKES